MKCKKCNSELEKNSNFCPSCGKKIKNENNLTQKLNFNINYVVIIFLSLAVIFYLGLNENKKTNKPIENAKDPHADLTDKNIIQTIKTLEDHLKTNPDNKDFILALANTLQDARFYPRAIEMYKKYLNLESKNANALVDLGICYFESGNSDLALKTMKDAIKVDKNHQMAMFNLGIVNLNLGNIKESNLWFEKTISANPTNEIGLKAKEFISQHIEQNK